eukprot:gene10647-22228_t
MIASLVLIAQACLSTTVLSMVATSPRVTAPTELGYSLTKLPGLNRGASFTPKERDALKIRGLFPAGEPISLEIKLQVAMENLRSKTSPLEKYIFLHTIQDADETLYYETLIKHTSEVMPFVYTPTVGEACQKWSRIYRHTPRGLYLSINDLGQIRGLLDNYPQKNIKVICVTDGERILGLGDLGANGMGIPIGKLALYVACAGIDPSQVLPVHIDVGTNRMELHSDPTYMGLRRTRERGPDYDKLIEEFFSSCQDAYGKDVLIQFEDFGNSNAFRLLETYRNKACCFNDDIQGTASVVLAGFIASKALSGKQKLGDHTYMFLGAGEAGVGIANLLASAIATESGCTIEEANKKIHLVDSKGLITASRDDFSSLAHHKLPYAHAAPVSGQCTDLLTAVKAVKPSAIVGVSAQGGAFTQEVVEEMARNNEHPLVFALSNPTSKAECTAANAYKWSKGKAIFASGSPFDDLTLEDGTKRIPGQGNNAYIFPGVGLAAVLSGASSITDNDFFVAAETLAHQVLPERLQLGCLYPSLNDIREVSAVIAAAVCDNVYASGRATKFPKPNNML